VNLDVDLGQIARWFKILYDFPPFTISLAHFSSSSVFRGKNHPTIFAVKSAKSVTPSLATDEWRSISNLSNNYVLEILFLFDHDCDGETPM